MEHTEYIEKMKYMSIMLWEYQNEIRELKRQLAEKENIIEDLKAEIILSDLELKDITRVMEQSQSVEVLNKLCSKVHMLSVENKEYNENYNMTVNLLDYEYVM